jgi:hypothetical protein
MSKDEHLQGLLSVTHNQTLEFFLMSLKDVCEEGVDQRELFYTASVLATFAQVSTASATDLPTPASLSAVFDHFVFNNSLRDDPLMIEIAGAQCLLLTGFFQDQMARRHNIKWYSELGRGFFKRASVSTSLDRRWILSSLSVNFEAWRERHARLSRELRDQQYLLFRTPYGG